MPFKEALIQAMDVASKIFNSASFFYSAPKLPTFSEYPELHGTYRGFAPTDESPNGLGELEVVINSKEMKVSHATGLKINVSQFQHSELRRAMTFIRGISLE